MVHLHNETLLNHEKKEILHFVTAWMDLNTVMLTEASQRTTTVWFHLYVESTEQNKLTNNIERLIATENRLTAVTGAGCWQDG